MSIIGFAGINVVVGMAEGVARRFVVIVVVGRTLQRSILVKISSGQGLMGIARGWFGWLRFGGLRYIG